MKNKFMKYLKTGFKLALVLFLGSLIMFIPLLILKVIFIVSILTYVLLMIPFVIISLIVDGWLIIKYKNWIFK